MNRLLIFGLVALLTLPSLGCNAATNAMDTTQIDADADSIIFQHQQIASLKKVINPDVKVPRSQCDQCGGTGRVGDGVVSVPCGNCYDDSRDPLIDVPDDTGKREDKIIEEVVEETRRDPFQISMATAVEKIPTELAITSATVENASLRNVANLADGKGSRFPRLAKFGQALRRGVARSSPKNCRVGKCRT